jgi:protein-L-isoaspartate(D-aspartate) O-methyltransferase
VSRARIWQRSGKTVSARTVFDAAAKPLPGFERKPEFVF